MVDEQEQTTETCGVEGAVRIPLPHMPERVLRVRCQLPDPRHMRLGLMHVDGMYRWNEAGRVEIMKYGEEED